MQEHQQIPLEPLGTKYIKKEDLVKLVSKCQERKFAEEVDFIEELGGISRKPMFK
jgi:hypothetical protein